MATHRAIRECFHNAHLFKPGDEAIFAEGDIVPRHFKPIESAVPQEREPEPGKPHKVHRGFGKWDVIGADGAVVTEKTVSKAEAETILAGLL